MAKLFAKLAYNKEYFRRIDRRFRNLKNHTDALNDEVHTSETNKNEKKKFKTNYIILIENLFIN